MSSPGFLLYNDSNHDLLQSLLESMNAIIEHQFVRKFSDPSSIYIPGSWLQEFVSLDSPRLVPSEELGLSHSLTELNMSAKGFVSRSKLDLSFYGFDLRLELKC
jgi:hypothetical protein